MPQHLQLKKFVIVSFILSFALHAVLITAVFFLPGKREDISVFPVDIVELPKEPLKKPPPASRPRPVPVPKPRSLPQKRMPPDEVPKPEKFGTDDRITLPKTEKIPRTGRAKGAEKRGEKRKETGKTDREQAPERTGPLPFLSQNDIDQLARKGMPTKKPGDESVTLDTDEFKFISYNRWLKIKVESVMNYPELAAISGYQGTIFIKFDIMKDGSLHGLEILKSSGYKILDDEALRSIRAAAPFQPLPGEWEMERYSIRAAVIFYLGQGYIR